MAGPGLSSYAIYIVTFSFSLIMVQGLPSTLNVALVLPSEGTGGPIDFGYRWALQALNRDKLLLPNTTLIPITLYVKDGDSFRASKELCNSILSKGVVAILGGASSRDPSLEWKLFWTAAALDVPLFFSTPSYSHTKNSKKANNNEFALRLSPSLEAWSTLLRQLCTWLRLQGVAILYEDERGLMRTQGLLREPSPVEHIIVRRVEGMENYVDVLKDVKRREIRHMIIDCYLTSLPHLLKAIVNLQMTDYKYHYILTNLDLGTVDMSEFSRSLVNLTSFQIVNQEGRYLNEKFQELKDLGDEERFPKGIFDMKSPAVKAETGFAFDSVMALGLGLSALDTSHVLKPANLSCSKGVPWADGLSLLNYINSVEFKGLSGQVSFKEGARSTFKIDVVRHSAQGWKRVGLWTPERGLNITKPKSFWEIFEKNVTLTVTCVLEAPYVMLRPNLTGNDRFQGFSISLLEKIAEKVGFNYKLEVVPDGKYGVYDHESGEWNGVVRQLMDRNVDIAVGAITVSHARETVIDFTKPFMNLGISILFKKPTRPPVQLFSFLNPLALEIWLSVVGSYVLVSLTMFIVARFSPREWTTMETTLQGNQVIRKNQFSLANAFWYPIGTLMQQGSDLNPKTTSTRIVGGIWWFFSIVIVSSYTANLAAFLTVERMTTPIESAEDLAEQGEITYGSLESGSTMAFFRDSKIELYQKMWRFMESKKPSVFTSSYPEGMKRVLDGNYAFLMESTTIEYMVKKNCNLTQIGGLLDSKDFGIALPIGSPWRDKISLAILEMQELGVIQQERNRWWGSDPDSREDDEEEEDGNQYCNVEYRKTDAKASALGVDNIGGIFVVLVIGLVLAVTVAVLEFCWHAKATAHSDQISLWSEMVQEAKFAFHCSGPRRRPALMRHCGKCEGKRTRAQTTVAYHDYHTYPHQHNYNTNNLNINGGGGGNNVFNLATVGRRPSLSNTNNSVIVRSISMNKNNMNLSLNSLPPPPVPAPAPVSVCSTPTAAGCNYRGGYRESQF